MVEQTDSNYQSQQQFISDSPWSSEELMTKIGIDEVVLFSRTLFLSDFQTDIIQNGGWLDPSPRSESVCIGGARKVIKNFMLLLFGDIVFRTPWALNSQWTNGAAWCCNTSQ